MCRRSIIILIMFLIGESSSLTGCRRPSEEQAKPKTGTVALLTSSVIQWLLSKAMEVSVERKFDAILDALEGSSGSLGEAESTFSKGVATKLDVALDHVFERDIKIKLHALETSLVMDYIPGLGESTTELALMNQKANEIRSAIEIFAADKKDLRRLGMALAHHRTYLLASAIKLYVHSERLRLARASLGDQAAPVTELKKSLKTLAKDTSSQLTYLAQDVLLAYARARLLSYEYKITAKREEFGFKQDIKYAYCVHSKSMTMRCGTASKILCASELSADCVTKAKKEALDAFTAEEVEKPFTDALREEIFDPSWEGAEQNLRKLSLHR